MRSRLLVMLLSLPALFGFSDLEFSGNVDQQVIIFNGPTERIPIDLQGADTDGIQVCGLEIGQTYQIAVAQTPNCHPYFKTPGQAKVSNQTITLQATDKCMTVHVWPAAGVSVCNDQVYLSINCVSCEMAPLPPQDQPEGGPIFTNSGVTPQQLIEDIFIGGGCFEVSNVSFSGDFVARGEFASGLGSIGLEKGIILSTGNIATATGPNNVGGAGSATSGGSDPDLVQVANGNNINDAAILEFDFTPTVPQISFRYVFASEEYCEYANTSFNDAFGFFLSGPGINGPFSGNSQNIAILPNGTQVSINNVNHVNNPAFYVSNIPMGQANCAGNPVAAGPGPLNCQYDGFTTVLTAVANVIPCETYHIKLAVGDGTDSAFDSAVFLEANSFDAGGQVLLDSSVPITGSELTFETCGNGFFTFTRNGGLLSDPITVNFTIGGTATPGLDYQPLPTSVTIPPFAQFIQIPVNVIADLIQEGQESIILTLDEPCNCQTSTAEIFIQDLQPLDVDIQDIETCVNFPFQIPSSVSGGLQPISYQWSNGLPTPTYQGVATDTMQVTLTVSDICGQSAQATANIYPYTIDAELSGSGFACADGTTPDDQFLDVTFTGPGPYDFTYIIQGAGNPITVEGVTQNPYQIPITDPGVYQIITVSDGANCLNFPPETIEVETVDIDVSGLSTDPLCFNGNNGELDISVDVGTGPFTYAWSNGDNSEDLDGLNAGDYTVTVTDDVGCEEEFDFTLGQPGEINPTIEGTVGVDCADPTGGEIDLSVAGGTPGYTYLWSNGANTEDLTGVAAGTYTVLVTDANGCSVQDTAQVQGDIDIPDADVNVTGQITCLNNIVTLDGSGSSAGPNIIYTWAASSGGSITSDPSQPSITVESGGTYELTVEDQSNGCFSVASVIVQENTAQPLANAQINSQLDCDVTQVQINGSGIGGNVTYNWTTSGGSFVSNPTVEDPIVDGPGIYQLIVTDQLNGCTDTATVQVNQDITPPLADAGTDGLIDCAVSSINLDASGSSGSGNITYQWSASGGGNIVGSTTVPNPEVDAAGTYTVLITDDQNGCTATASVDVTDAGDEPTVDIAPPALLTCVTQSIVLDGSGSTGAGNLSYQWTASGGGTIVSGGDTPQPTVNNPGFYELEIVDDANGCSNTLQIEVLENVDQPVADAGPQILLSCLTPNIQLDGSNSTAGPTIEYQWTEVVNGNIVSGANTATPTINAPGTYQLQVTNTANGCVSTDLIVIEGDSETPIAATLPVNDLDCEQSIITLNGSGSSVGPNFTYQWSTPNGNILNGAQTLFAEVDQPGDYTLAVFNTNNGCETTIDVTVQVDTLAPAVDAGAPDLLTCEVTSLTLDGSASAAGPGISYEWTTSNGSIQSDELTPMPTIDGPGTYVLTVVNNNNGCVSVDSVTINEDVALPIADINPPATLNCTVTDLVIDGSGSTTGPNITYAWSTNDGNILAGGDTNSPLIDAPGTYEVTILNTNNGCLTTETVDVSQNVQVPTADAGPTAILDCINTELSLDGNGSSIGGNIVYSWTTGDGTIVSGQNTTTPTVNDPGTYQLIVVDNNNTCADTATVTITEDVAIPAADAGTPATLTCDLTSIQLDGTGSSAGNEFVYSWTAVGNGQIDGPSDVLNPTVSTPGTYEIEVTNTQNGCVSTAMVTIDENTTEPTANAGADGVLNCATTDITLNGGGSSASPTITYQWTPIAGGNIVSGATSTAPVIDAPGTYELLVVDAENGCESTDVVEISEDVTIPVADPGAATTLTCDVVNYTLGQGASTTGPAISYTWSTQDGSITGATNVLETDIDGPGTYQLIVFNNDNFCSDTAAVSIDQDITPPTVEAGPAFVLDCAATSVQLDGTGTSAGANFVYTWLTNDGNLISGTNGLNPTINQAGTYELVVENTDNGCEATDEVIVTQDADAPTANAGQAPDLTCAVTELDLNGTANSVSGNFEVIWTPIVNGNILAGANTLNPTIDLPGTYQLQVTDLDNNCVAFSTVIVGEDVQQPDAVADSPNELNCDNATVSVTGIGSSQGAEFTYQWSTNTGTIVSGDTSLDPVVAAPGTYTLLVTDTDNGCTQTTDVVVTQDTLHPSLSFLTPEELTCTLTETDLLATVVNGGSNFTIDWGTTGGTFVSGTNTLQPIISAPGLYTLEVENPDNGCSSTASVTVNEDVELPTAEAGATNELDCDNPSLSLDGSGSDQGANFTYVWTASNGGVITAGQTSLTPTITSAGTYEIEVTNQDNGCVSTDVVSITIDTISPVVLLADPADLTCIVLETNINANGSSSGPNFTYDWTTTTGNIVNENDPLSPLINQPGSYTLTIENQDNGCEAAASISVIADIAPPGAEAGNAEALNCTDESISLTGSAITSSNVSYSWSTTGGNIVQGAASANPEVDEPGIYSVLITDLINGCTSVDSVEVTSNFPTAFLFENTLPVCNTSTGIIEFIEVEGGQPPYLYTIDGGENYFTSGFYAALEPGTYELGIQDANGCELSEVLEMPEGTEVEMNLEAQVIVNLGETYVLDAGVNVEEDQIASVTWTPTTGLSCTDCLSPAITPTENLSYEVAVTTIEGCEATARVNVLVRKEQNVYVPTAFSPNGDGENDVFMIFANDQIARVNQFMVFNRWGEKVHQYFLFEPNDPSYGWDGTQRGQLLDPAVFTWFAEIEYVDGRTEVFKGDVTLLR